MDRHRQAVALGGLVDGPVALMTQRRFGGGGEQHLHEVRVVADAIDFLRRRRWILRRDEERRLEATVGVVPAQPEVDRIVVVGAGQRAGKVGVGQGTQAENVAAVEDGMLDVVAVHQLVAQPGRIAPRLTPSRRGHVGAVEAALATHDPAAGAAEAALAHMPAPRFWQVGMQLGVIVDRRMHVGVDDVELGLAARRRARLFCDSYHRAVSSRYLIWLRPSARMGSATALARVSASLTDDWPLQMVLSSFTTAALRSR